MLTPQSESRCDFVQDELVITELDRRPQIPYNQAKSLNLIKITVKFLFGLVTPLRPYQKKFLFLQKFLEYFVHINTAFFCTLSYPEDASKINAKHVVFLNQMSEIYQKYTKKWGSLRQFLKKVSLQVIQGHLG